MVHSNGNKSFDMDKREKFLWISAIGVFGAGMYMLYKSVSSRLTAIIKYNRQIIACRINACMMISNNAAVSGLNGVPVKFDVPLYKLAFYGATDITGVKSALAAIKNQYGIIIASVAQLTNLPEILLRGFIFIESGGKANVVGGKSIGLMQIDPVTAHGMIFLENKQGRLSLAEKTVFKKYLGTRLDLILKDKWMNQSQHVTAADLYNPEFNLLVGAIYLGILVDEHTEGDVLRLDKIVSRYNRGYFSKSGLTGDLMAVYNNQPSITKSYILKLAGTNGVLDLMTT